MSMFFFANRTGSHVHIRLVTDSQDPPRFVFILKSRPDDEVFLQGMFRSVAHGGNAHHVPELDSVARKERKIVIRNHIRATTATWHRDSDDDLILIITTKN